MLAGFPWDEPYPDEEWVGRIHPQIWSEKELYPIIESRNPENIYNPERMINRERNPCNKLDCLSPSPYPLLWTDIKQKLQTTPEQERQRGIKDGRAYAQAQVQRDAETLDSLAFFRKYAGQEAPGTLYSYLRQSGSEQIFGSEQIIGEGYMIPTTTAEREYRAGFAVGRRQVREEVAMEARQHIEQFAQRYRGTASASWQI